MKGRTIGALALLGLLVLATTLPTWLSGTVVTVTAAQPLAVSGATAAP